MNFQLHTALLRWTLKASHKPQITLSAEGSAPTVSSISMGIGEEEETSSSPLPLSFMENPRQPCEEPVCNTYTSFLDERSILGLMLFSGLTDIPAYITRSIHFNEQSC